MSVTINDDNTLEQTEEVVLALEVIGDDTRVSIQKFTTLLILDDESKLSINSCMSSNRSW